MTIKAVLFDLDGTLLDTSRDLGGALNRLREEEGLSLFDEATLRAQISNGANALVKLGFGELEASAHQYYRQRLLDHYAENIAEFTEPFEGIFSLIERLTEADLNWGIVTNKPLAYTTPLMTHFSFTSEPAVTICPEHVKQSKPAPDALILACDTIKLDTSEIIYVGDHLRDIECGKRAGSKTIAVGYGFTETPEEHLDWGADHNVDHANEIWPIVESYLLETQ